MVPKKPLRILDDYNDNDETETTASISEDGECDGGCTRRVRFRDEAFAIPDRTNSSGGGISDGGGESSISADSGCDEVSERWYGSDEYRRFKRDRVLSSLNYINAKRANKPWVDESEYSIRGIEHMCAGAFSTSADADANQAATKRHRKAIRDEQ